MNATAPSRRNHPVLGSLEMPVSMEAITGYHRFSSPGGIDGLSKFTDTRLDLLVVVARGKPGQGCFREFLGKAKRQFRTICMWQFHNERLLMMLKREGFIEATDVQCGERITGLRWDRQQGADDA